jgi:hypothetical protein
VVQIGERCVSILHYSQLASLLEIALDEDMNIKRLVWDCVALLELWLTQVRLLPWSTLVEPIPTNTFTLQGLVVNVFRPFQHAVDAWESGHYGIWSGEADEQTEYAFARQMASAGAKNDLLAYAEPIFDNWQGLCLDHFGDDVTDPIRLVVMAARGPMAFSTLFAFMRWHTAFHLKETELRLDELGIEHPSFSLVDDLGAFNAEFAPPLRSPARPSH